MKVTIFKKERIMRKILMITVIACLTGIVTSCDSVKRLAGMQTECNGNPCITNKDWRVEILSVRGIQGTQEVVVTARITDLGTRSCGTDRAIQYNMCCKSIDDRGRASACSPAITIDNRPHRTGSIAYNVDFTRNVPQIITFTQTVSPDATMFRRLEFRNGIAGMDGTEAHAVLTNIPIFWE